MVYAKKKPIVIEATQWNKYGDHANVVPYLSGLRVSTHNCSHCGKSMEEHGWVDTLEGGHIVCPSDYIIKGFHGELYPIKNHIFLETYEVVKDNTEKEKQFEAEENLITQENWEELNADVRAYFHEASNLFRVYLFGCKTAKNYLAIPVRYTDSKWDFNIIFRKKNCDSKIICPTCANIHAVNARRTHKQESPMPHYEHPLPDLFLEDAGLPTDTKMSNNGQNNV